MTLTIQGRRSAHSDAGDPRARRDHRRRMRRAWRGRDADRHASPASPAPGDSSAPSARRPVASVPDCGTDPVKLNIYHETISELMPQLSAEFTKQYPNVTFDLKSDAFANATANLPRLLAGDNPPDISRAAQLIDLVEGRPAPEPRPLRDGVRVGRVAAGASSRPSASIDDFKRGTGSIIAWPVNCRARSASSTTRTSRRRSA